MRHFFWQQHEKIKRNLEGAKILQNVASLVEKTGMEIRMEETSDDVALFSSGLDVDDPRDFDGYGMLTRVPPRVIIKIGCLRAPKTSSVFYSKSGKYGVLCISSYLGKKKHLSGQYGDVNMYEIGVTHIPFYFLLSHELLHLTHFLETVYYKEHPDEKSDDFIPYGLALRVRGYDDYYNAGLLSEKQREAVGELPEFEEIRLLEEKWNAQVKTSEKGTFQ